MTIRILALVAFLLAAGSAQAIPTVAIVWRAPQHAATIGTPSVSASATVTADVVLRGDSSGPSIIGVFVSIEYDTAELTALNVTELASVNLPGMGNSMSPVLSGTGELVPGIITNFEEATLTTGLATDESRTLGSVVFHIVAATGDASDVDVIASLQNAGTDTISGAGGATLGADFVGASVVPEPASAALGGAALLTLLGLKRLRGRTRS